MDHLPRMLYRDSPTGELMHGVRVDYCIVKTEADLAEATEHGWCYSPALAEEARIAALKAVTEIEPEVDLLSPPTRAELEQQARALGCKFDGRTSEKRLAEIIDAAMTNKSMTAALVAVAKASL